MRYAKPEEPWSRPGPAVWVWYLDGAAERISVAATELIRGALRETLLASTQLAGPVHGDPADRMLIASASLAGVPLATADPLILAYAEQQAAFSACDVRP